MTIIRAAHPKMRRNNPTAIIHSGGKQTIYGCICGAKHTTSTEWNGRKAKHVTDWRCEHAACADKIAAQIAAGLNPNVTF